MSGLVIGTAAQALAGPTTSLAGLPASSVVHLRMSTQVGATTPVTFHAREVILVLVVVLLQVDLDGNLVIGFAAGRDATNTTSLAEWNVSDAMPRGTRHLITCRHAKDMLSNFGQYCSKSKSRDYYNIISLIAFIISLGFLGFSHAAFYTSAFVLIIIFP